MRKFALAAAMFAVMAVSLFAAGTAAADDGGRSSGFVKVNDSFVNGFTFNPRFDEVRIKDDEIRFRGNNNFFNDDLRFRFNHDGFFGNPGFFDSNFGFMTSLDLQKFLLMHPEFFNSGSGFFSNHPGFFSGHPGFFGFEHEDD